MKRLPGQALRGLHFLARLAMATLVAVVIALVVLAWRLGEGPLPIPALARQIEQAVNRPGATAQLRIGQAAIAWEGFHSGTAAPLDIRLQGVRLVNAAGAVRAELPDAAATISLAALLHGRVVPATIDLVNPTLLLVRSTDGALTLGGPNEPPPAPEAAPTDTAEPAEPAPEMPGLSEMLAALTGPTSDAGSLTALRRLRVNGGSVTVLDRKLGRSWALQDPHVDVRRAAAGGLSAEGSAMLTLAGLVVPVRLSGQVVGSPPRLTLGLTLPSLRPAELAAVLPDVAELGRLDAPVALGLFADVNADGSGLALRARVSVGAGSVEVAPGQRLSFAALEANGSGNAATLTLREARLRLPGQGGRLGPELVLAGDAALAEGLWQARLHASMAGVAVPELGRAWPEWAAPELRAQALARLPAGRLREAALSLTLALNPTDGSFAWQRAEARLALEQAELDFAEGGRRRVESLELLAQASPERVVLERLALRLPGLPPLNGPANAPLGRPTTLSLTAEATRPPGDAAAPWRLLAQAGLDQAEFADLPRIWPSTIATAPHRWLTQNVTAGLARNGRWTLEATLPASLDDVVLTALSGGLEVSDATVHWLRPVPPLVGASGTVEFRPTEIIVRAQGGRQTGPDGRPGALTAREATLRFHGLNESPGYLDLVGQLGGPLTEVMTLLRHPRLKLFEKRPLELDLRAGMMEGRLTLALPLLEELPLEQLRLRASARGTGVQLQDVVLDKDITQGTLDLAVDTETLKLAGEALLDETPVRVGLELDFRGGAPTQVLERAQLSGRMDASGLAGWGVDAGHLLHGPLGVQARYERRRDGRGTVTVNADLAQAVLAVPPLNWTKPAGTPGQAEVIMRLAGNNLAALDSFRVEALELALRGRASFGPGASLQRLELVDSLFGGSRVSGDVRPPAAPGGPWQVALRGPLLDLRPFFGTTGHVTGGAAAPPAAVATAAPEPPAASAPVAVELRFDRLTMGLGRDLMAVQGRARTDAQGLLREARVAGSTGPNLPFEATLTPRGDQRVLRLTASDGGALLRALDLVQPVQGGRLVVNGVYEELRPGAPLVGTAELENFVVRDAPTIGKILQAMTLYGLGDALSGPGLNFARLVAPFRLTPEALELTDARAFSASLGLTARGRVLREAPVIELEGTIVPAYVFNTLLGNIPLLGRIFSPEAGGGVFAATWRVQGPTAAPEVTINPLAALTPGFLRGLFGIVETPLGQGRRQR